MEATQEIASENQTLHTFADELLLIKKQAVNDLSKADIAHLMKVIWINRILMLVGFATAWIIPNPFSMICISLALYGKWTIVAHHVCHGGYDKVPSISNRYLSNRFAMKWRRYVDWLDWVYPPAWKYEHNTLHHFYTNETLDPDVVRLRVKQYVTPTWPKWYKFTVLCLYICFWKPSYYSANTLKAYCERKEYDYKKSPSDYLKMAFYYNYIPYIGINFILLPMLFLPLGWLAVLYVFINRLGAEILTNIHTFLTIVPNHTGDDIPMIINHFTNKETFFVNQIKSSTNYHTGGFIRDYLHGYLNYQIEHHLFPELPPSQYAKMQPAVKQLCRKYKIDYKQESIFIRIRKTFEVLLAT